MGIDDVIAELELDVLDCNCDLDLDVELLFGDCLGNGVLLVMASRCGQPFSGHVCR
jgi:hypothetical protein